MNIVTISNEKWLDDHAIRFLRLARNSNPTANITLIYTGVQNEPSNDICGRFDRVVRYPVGADCRDWYNTVRLKMNDLGIGEYLYVDVDVDILQDLSGIMKQPGDILWARSPTISQEFAEMCDKKGWNKWGANNGMLYIRKDYSTRYTEILESLKAEGCSPRLVGTYAFNQLVRENKEVICEMPYYNDVIFWDMQSLATAKAVHWCNVVGQAKRVALEKIWRDAL